MTSQRTGKSLQTYTDVGNFIQKELSDKLRKPSTLIIKLKGIGTWYLRKMRMEIMLSLFPDYYEIEGYNDFPSEDALKNFTNKQELYKIFKERLKDYEKYLELKRFIREERNKTEPLILPKPDED